MKTAISLFLSITILLFACCLVFAQQNRWSYVGADVNGTQFFIDRKSINTKGNKLQIWNKSIYSDDSYRISLVQWVCTDKKYFILDETIYAPNGSFAGTDKGTKWLFVTPDSISEGLYRATCFSSKQVSSRTSAGKMRAQIIVKSANVRIEPDMSSRVKRKVKSGEQFVLAEEESVNGWYRIIISGTDNIGWIHGNNIKLVENSNQLNTRKRRKQ